MSNSADLTRLDPHAELRNAAAAFGLELTKQVQLGTVAELQAGAQALNAAWNRLLPLMVLGSAPTIRVCPVCLHSGMSTAKLCGFCWTIFDPPGSSAPPIQKESADAH